MGRATFTANVILAFFSLTQPASAHDYWSNGVRVPDEIKDRCCGVADAHADVAVIHADHFYCLVEHKGTCIYDTMVKQSPDGHVWAFYRDGDAPAMFCLFLPILARGETNDQLGHD